MAQAAKQATNLLFASNYIQLPLQQLVKPDGGAALAGTTGYDWLTVDADEGALVTVAGGNVGVVKPELKRITGLVWHDENNNGVQDKLESGAFEQALNGYQVTLERYYSTDGSGTWVRDNSGWGDVVDGVATSTKTVRTGDTLMEEGTATSVFAADKLGEHLSGADLWRQGTYSFDKLETAGVVDGKWVVYGYKVRISDARVARGQVLKAKNRVTANESGDAVDWAEDSDLFGNNYAVDGNEYIVLLDQVDADGKTADGQTTRFQHDCRACQQ